METERRWWLGAGLVGAACTLSLSGCSAAPASRRAEGQAVAGTAGAADQARAAEQAFAAAMAARDFAAFAAHVADDAVFLGSGAALRGKAAVLAAWRRFFEAPRAPFSWRPEHVEVDASGTLALSEGPVAAPDGKVFARYISTWRREPDGRWRVVFDNGYDVCAR